MRRLDYTGAPRTLHGADDLTSVDSDAAQTHLAYAQTYSPVGEVGTFNKVPVLMKYSVMIIGGLIVFAIAVALLVALLWLKDSVRSTVVGAGSEILGVSSEVTTSAALFMT